MLMRKCDKPCFRRSVVPLEIIEAAPIRDRRSTPTRAGVGWDNQDSPTCSARSRVSSRRETIYRAYSTLVPSRFLLPYCGPREAGRSTCRDLLVT